MTIDPTTADFTFAVDERSIGFVLDEDIYPRDCIYGAAYLFVDRCWIFLDRPGDRQVQVRLRAKDEQHAEVLAELAGEFANELLTHG